VSFAPLPRNKWYRSNEEAERVKESAFTIASRKKTEEGGGDGGKRTLVASLVVLLSACS
jgi:hypothetical protein